MTSTPPTARKQNAETVLDKSQKVRQPAFTGDKESSNKENAPLAITDNSSNFRIMSKPLSARNLDTHNQQTLQAARKDLVLKSDASAPAPKSLKDMCDNMRRPGTAPAMTRKSSTDEQEAAQEALTCHGMKQDRARAATARLRGTRLGGAPQRVIPTGYEGDESEFDVERSEPEWDGASQHGAAASVQSSRQGARSTARGGGERRDLASWRGEVWWCRGRVRRGCGVWGG